MRKLDAALGSRPAALLAGSNEIEKSFALTKRRQRQDGLDWLEAEPKTQGHGVRAHPPGLRQGGLEAMELTDQFGQTTVIKFSNLERNAKITPDDVQLHAAQRRRRPRRSVSHERSLRQARTGGAARRAAAAAHARRGRRPGAPARAGQAAAARLRVRQAALDDPVGAARRRARPRSRA